MPVSDLGVFMQFLSPRSVIEVGVCVMVIGLTAIPAFAVASRPVRPYAMAAVFPPWWSAERVRAAVEPIGEITSTGRMTGIVAVVGGADLSKDLHRAGAWFTLNADPVACTKSPGAAA